MKSQSSSDPSPGSPRLVWPVAAALGEGPVWIESQRALWFVDIQGQALHRWKPATGARASFALPGLPSFVVPADDGALVVGMGMALYRFDIDAGALGDRLAPVDGDAQCRTNDATVDARGRLWFGTMDIDETRPVGRVHVYDGVHVRPVGGDCTITNGPAISPDGRTLYHVDTLARTVWAFDIARHDVLVDGRVFARIAAADGHPDGVTVDADGAVWVALWGGSGVRRYAASGELLCSVALPCTQVTKVAFGGDGLRTAFVSTARTGLSAHALAREPLAGGLFAFEVAVPGLPTPAVRIGR